MGRTGRIPERENGLRGGLVLSILVAMGLPACGTGSADIPSPRPLVVFSGARVHADSTEMQAVDRWVRRVQAAIGEDDALHMEVVPERDVGPPWEAVAFEEDGPVHVRIPTRAGASETPYRIYAFLQMMEQRGELGRWLPLEEGEEVETPDDPFRTEEAIVERVAAVWLLGRAIYDTAPFGLLDQLVYAREYGYLEAYLLTARGDEFEERREAWVVEHPAAVDEYREWFRATFEDDPPGWEAVAELREEVGQ